MEGIKKKSEKISSPGMPTTFFGISKEHNVICEVNDFMLLKGSGNIPPRKIPYDKKKHQIPLRPMKFRNIPI